MNEDWKDQIKIAEDNHRAEVNDSLEAQDAARKALRSKGAKLKQFLYSGTEELQRQIRFMYPTATHLVTVNLDNTDTLGIPETHTRQMTARFTDVTYTQGKRVLRSVSYDAFHVVLCYVKGGIVTLKHIVKDRTPQ